MLVPGLSRQCMSCLPAVKWLTDEEKYPGPRRMHLLLLSGGRCSAQALAAPIVLHVNLSKRVEGTPDLLDEILKPLATGKGSGL